MIRDHFIVWFEMVIELVRVVLKRRLHGLLEKLDLLLAERVLIVIERFVALHLLSWLLDCDLINHILFSYVLVNTALIKGRHLGAIVDDSRVPIKVLLPGFLALILINEHELLSLTLIGVYGVQRKRVPPMINEPRTDEAVIVLHEYLLDPRFRLVANWPAIRILNLPHDDLWCKPVLSHCSLESLPLQLLLLLHCGRNSCPKRLVLLLFIPLTILHTTISSLLELRYLNITSCQCSHRPRLVRGELNLTHVEDLPQALSASHLRSPQPQP